MRFRTVILLGVVWLSFLSLILTSFNLALAGTYLGEFKWSITPDENELSETLFTGITHVGGDYFSVQGYLIPSDGDGIIIGDGSAVIRDNTLYMTLHNTQTHTDSQYRDAITWRIEVDIRTFSGIFWAVGGNHGVIDRETEYSDYIEGTIRLLNE